MAGAGEAGDGGRGGVEVGDEVGEDEAEEEVLVGGGEVRDARGTHDVGPEAAEGRVGERVVEGDESRHGGGGFEGENSDGRSFRVVAAGEDFGDDH